MRQARSTVSHGSWVAGGTAVMNVAAYGFTVLAARLLAPAEFGAVTALLGLLLVGNVAALGLQTSTARRLAVTASHGRDDVVATTLRVTAAIAVTVGGLVGLSTVVLSPALNLSSPWPVVLAGATLVPMTVVGAQFGIAQGTGQWRLLATIYGLNGLGRFLGGGLGLVVAPTTTGALVGVAIGAWLPVVAGSRLLLLGGPARSGGPRRSFLREAFLGSHALLAYFVLSSMDALLARNLFDAETSGLYGSGLVLTKAALFFPQFISIVAFPGLARARTGHARAQAAALVLAIGLVAVAGTATLSPVALELAGGSAYAEIQPRLWLFTLSGSMLAVVHLLVFDALARHAHRVVGLLWTAVAGVLVVAYGFDVDLTGLVTTVVTIATLLAVALLLVPGRATDRR